MCQRSHWSVNMCQKQSWSRLFVQRSRETPENHENWFKKKTYNMDISRSTYKKSTLLITMHCKYWLVQSCLSVFLWNAVAKRRKEKTFCKEKKKTTHWYSLSIVLFVWVYMTVSMSAPFISLCILGQKSVQGPIQIHFKGLTKKNNVSFNLHLFH